MTTFFEIQTTGTQETFSINANQIIEFYPHEKGTILYLKEITSNGSKSKMVNQSYQTMKEMLMPMKKFIEIQAQDSEDVFSINANQIIEFHPMVGGGTLLHFRVITENGMKMKLIKESYQTIKELLNVISTGVEVPPVQKALKTDAQYLGNAMHLEYANLTEPTLTRGGEFGRITENSAFVRASISEAINGVVKG